jgi:hypothetical protein
MAFAHQQYYGTVEVVDQGGNLSVLTFELQGATIANAGTNLGTIVSNLAAVTDGWIRSYQLHDKWVTDVLFTASEPHGEVSTKALITVQLTTPGKTASVEIPAPKDAIFSAGSGSGFNLVDPTNADVSTFLNQYNSGSQAKISDGEFTITGPFLKGRRIHRKSLNG